MALHTASVPLFSPGAIAVNALGILFWVVIIIMFVALFIVIWRVLKYNYVVEVWEKKGEEVTLLGDLKGKKTNKRGISYLEFMGKTGFTFSVIKFPDNKFHYPKKLLGLMTYGTKLKMLMVNDELIPFQMRLGNPHGLMMDAMPANQKMDFIQRFKSFDEKYQADPNRMAMIQLAGIGILVLGMIIMGFFYWQQNVEIAALMREGISTLAASIESGGGRTIEGIAPG